MSSHLYNERKGGPAPKTVPASITLSWRGDSGKGHVKLPELELAPFATRQLQIGAMQKQLGIPEDTHWALVGLSSPASPDDLMAIAASFDATGRYGAESVFSDNLGGHFEGGEWHVDANHNQLMTVTNGGSKSAQALLTLHYANGTKKYEMQQAIPPGEQMWINLAELIHNRMPDRKGDVLPADLPSGTYDLQDLGHGPGSLMIASLAPDSLWGNQRQPPQPECCGTTAAFDLSPNDITIGGLGATINAKGWDICANQGFDLFSYVESWSSGNSAIATVTPGKVKGVAPGFTTADGETDPFYEGYGSNCHLVNLFPSGQIGVGPRIVWNSNNISGTTQSAVVGQQIALSSSYKLDPGVTVQSRSWTIAGTTVGGYNATSSSGATLPTDFAHDSATFYWVYPANPLSVTFTLNLSDGTHPSATASFNVSGGGSMSNAAYTQVTIDNLQPCDGGPLGPWMVYGNIAGTACKANPGGTWGISFTPSGAPSNGAYSYVQLLNADTTTFTGGSNKQTCTYSQGVDGPYPYAGIIPNSNPPQALDAPDTQLPSQTYTTVNRAFNATMFLLWTPTIANSIAVPIGYQTWAFNGTANCTASCGTTSNWTATTNGKPGPVGSFTPSKGNQTTDGYTALSYGYPLWGNTATRTCK